MQSPLSRRRFLELSSITGLGLLLAPIACTKAPNKTGQSFSKLFANPPRRYQPKFRWWWPHGLVDPNQIRREIDSMADAGFGGAEIADVHHSSREDLSADTHGWGSEPWRNAVQAALEQAAERGMSIDHSIGPSWPAASNLITPDSEAACKELATGIVSLAGGETFDDVVPPPPESKHSSKSTLQALQAIRLADRIEATPKKTVFVGDSLVDLQSFVSKDKLHWTAPPEGQWMIFSYWLRGSGQQPEGGPHAEPRFYVVDHFSEAGTQAIIDLWQKKVLTPNLSSLIKKVGGNIFEDSIEMETHETIWTPKMFEEFEARRGYSLLPYLPLITQKREKHNFQYLDFDSNHLLHDWWQTFSELFLEHHFEAIKKWAHSLGLGFRGQPYGLRTDAIRAAATLDISEGESLGFKNLDDYRSLAGGRDMGGHKILSNEAGAYHSSAYATTWKRVLKTLNPQFAAGVNQTVLHGFAYAEAPGAKWPGFAAFTPYGGKQGYSEAWGPRQPSWEHVSDIAGYFSRVHFLLQQGQPQVDVAFLRQKGYAGSGFGAPWFSKEGVMRGWTHNFISPSTLELPSAVVKNGHLAPEGPSYQVLVFEGDAFHQKKSNLPLQTAEKLVEFARAGLPILAVGDWSEATGSGVTRSTEEAKIRETMHLLLAEPTVHNVATREDIAQGIQKMGIISRVGHSGHSHIVNAQRLTSEARLYYFCNSNTKESAYQSVICRNISEDDRVYRLDLWTGEVSIDQTSNQQLNRDDLEAVFHLSLPPGSSTALAIAHKKWIKAPTLAPHTATPHFYEKGTEFPVDDWKLSLQEWLPGNSPSETKFKTHEHDLEDLKSWTEVSGLENASGMASYVSSFTIDQDTADSKNLRLHLGNVFNTLRVRINDRWLPPVNPLSHNIRIAGYAKPGKNQIEIQCSSTLLNRLIDFNPSVYGHAKPQAYGLSGKICLEG